MGVIVEARSSCRSLWRFTKEFNQRLHSTLGLPNRQESDTQPSGYQTPKESEQHHNQPPGLNQTALTM